MSPSRIHVALLVLLVVTGDAYAESLTELQRTQLWREARQQLLRNPRLVYHNGATELPEYPGFLVTNEHNAWTMEPNTGPPGLQVGFANTVNFNLLVARRNRTFVVADQSEETLVAMASFWRPLFLASASPAEFVANVAGLELEPGEDLDSVFRRVLRGERGTAVGMARLEQRLNMLTLVGVITPLDFRFCLAVVRDQVRPPPSGENATPNHVGVFRAAHSATHIASQLGRSYWIRGAVENARHSHHQNVSERATAISFLTPTGFAHVRDVLQNGGDHYAQTEVRDRAFWTAIAAMATRARLPVTDVYLSNILAVVNRSDRTIDQHLRDYLAVLPGRHVMSTYESQYESGEPFLMNRLDACPDNFARLAP